MTNDQNYFTLVGGQVFVDDRFQNCNVIVKDGIIQSLSSTQTQGQIIQLQPYHVVLPGFVELHAHLRHPGSYRKISLASELKAALRGGYHTVCCMANTNPVLDNVRIIKQLKFDLVELGSPVQVKIWSALTVQQADQKLVSVNNIAPLIVGFSDDGHSNENQSLWHQFLTTTHSLLFASHCQAPSSLWSHPQALLTASRLPDSVHAKQEPETKTLTWQLSQFAHFNQNHHLHIHHVSTRSAVKLIADFKLRFDKLTCEVTPHHLLLDNSTPQFATGWLRVAPPLRSFADRQALIHGLKTGTIDCIATDHAPHPLSAKNRSFQRAKPGFSGFETMFPLIYTFLIAAGLITWTDAVRATSIRPAAIARCPEPKIKPGQTANLVVIDLQTSRQVDANKLASASHSSPFQGWWLKGWTVYNVIKGQLYAVGS